MRSRGKTWSLVGLALAALAAGLLVLGEAGCPRPRPTPAKLLQRMLVAWSGIPGYQADISIGVWGDNGTPPEISRQWWRGDELVLAATDPMGFHHIERWRGREWEFYQPGAEVQAHVAVANAEQLPLGRWLASGYPTVGDVVQLILVARSPRVAGRADSAEDPAWMLECEPHPQVPASVPKSGLLHLFYARTTGRTWRVWLSDKTGLPIHVLISGPGSDPALRIGIQNLRVGSAFPPAWREVLGPSHPAKQFLRLSCDLNKPETLLAARRRILTKVDAWKRTLFGHGRGHPESS